MMKPKVALAASGLTRPDLLVKLPALGALLGPVMAPSFRLASRCSNALRAGYPVRSWTDVAEADAVLLCEPHDQIADTVDALRRARADWSGRTVVANDGRVRLAEMAPLRNAGATTAVLELVQMGDAPVCLLSGEGRLLSIRRLLLDSGAKVLISTESERQTMLSALFLCGPLVKGLLESALTQFGEAGLDTQGALWCIERQLRNATRCLGRGAGARQSKSLLPAGFNRPAAHAEQMRELLARR